MKLINHGRRVYTSRILGGEGLSSGSIDKEYALSSVPLVARLSLAATVMLWASLLRLF